MAKWSKDHVAAIGSLKNSTPWSLAKIWLKWRPGGATRGKGRQLVGKVGEWVCGKPAPSRLYPRLCQLRTVRLAPMSKYWTYRSHAGDIGPVILVTCGWWMFGFLHCFIGWLGRETGYRPTDRPAGVLRIVSGALFLGSSDSVQLCRRLVKGCHIRGLSAWSLCRAYVDWCGKRTCHVGRVFPCRVYIDSNRRNSRIWVTACLWHSSHS
jgi:hypothetical protein